MSVAIFFDDSGSTNGYANIWSRVAKIASENPTADFVFWNTTYTVSTYDEVMKKAKEMRGGGGTSISTITDYFAKNPKPVDRIIIVTDGGVDIQSVRNAQIKIDKNKYWKETEAHLVSSYKLDTSVIAPFISGVPFKVIDTNGNVVAETALNNEELIGLIDSIETPEQVRFHFLIFFDFYFQLFSIFSDLYPCL
jgi:hypothetical protein